ncbi:hypothetical protein [Halogeometricum limi]|uniref:Uncharacterized protein n=1 Tax=Halogeometricum limi TaxID=555875 RepID=A0A1I6H6Z2_9EURY|nr:hypothetical protein [Halogeometricum limi]SFR50091.1 hypothetical protein SAMN04488124_1845 [Halogeometricum limi]
MGIRNRITESINGFAKQFGIIMLAAAIVSYLQLNGDVGIIDFGTLWWGLYESAINSPVTQMGILATTVLLGFKLAGGIIIEIFDKIKKVVIGLVAVLITGHLLGFDMMGLLNSLMPLLGRF